MIIVLKPEASESEVDHIIDRLRDLGLKSQISTGQERTIIGVIGDDRILHNQPLTALPGVESVLPILAPWKLVSREFKKEETIIDVSGVKIGAKKLAIMAGPCAVERLELTVGIAHEVKASGATILRGGAYKPRTSPYSFQGLGREGLDYLVEARKQTGLPVVSEILDTRDIELFLEKADIIQIGAPEIIVSPSATAAATHSTGNSSIVFGMRSWPIVMPFSVDDFTRRSPTGSPASSR